MSRKKRKYCFALKPPAFEIKCPECGKTNLDWSEFENCIWCYDCEKDIEDYTSPLSGPVPIRVAYALGLNFDRINLETNSIEIYNINKFKYEI